jgi:3'(2'),5'-bisphosphate nucleotidase
MPTRPNDDPLLVALTDAALAGARAVMAVYATDFSMDRKADASPVSVADRQAEAVIVATLASAFPGVPIVAEEAVSEGRVPAIGEKFLLVDPLDGTKEFASRNGEFTVNIALVEHGMPTAGVVLAPALGLAYLGAGSAAWRAEIALPFERVADWQAIATRRAAAAPTAVASRSHSNAATEDALARANCHDRRSIGSSLKFCLVAEAAADFYPRLGPTMEWDTAAGDAVLRSAGGAVVTVDGEPLRYGKTSVVGMRDFENPHFLAVGDRRLLARLGLAKAA